MKNLKRYSFGDLLAAAWALVIVFLVTAAAGWGIVYLVRSAL